MRAGDAAIERRDREGEQLGRQSRMPISSAAMSMSRTAIHMRPMRPRTRFEAIQVITTTMASTTR